AALAGTMELPTDGLEAVAMAESFLNQNDPDVNLADVTVQFWCLVGDRNNDGSPDEKDVPKVCNPGASASWTCGDGLCISPCELSGTNMCNTMGVTATKDVPLAFTTLMGLPPVQITASRTGACKGLCGKEPPGPMDVIIILDRSGSMSGQDLADAKAGAKAVLEVFDPELHYVGLAVLGASQIANPCVVNNSNSTSGGGKFLVVGLSNDYQNADGTINTSSELVQTLDCIVDEGYTDLGGPIYDQAFGQPNALTELLNSSRTDVEKGIIFLSDGAANRPYTDSACQYANAMATIAKDQNVEIFTIGYGVESARCSTSESGLYYNMRVTALLAAMATDSADDQGHCLDQVAIDRENGDEDHFLCQPKGGDLVTVFRIAANGLVNQIKLIEYPTVVE
ncbi:MAG: vWA domain-containing protein, partial [Anaerolineales bacterium]